MKVNQLHFTIYAPCISYYAINGSYCIGYWRGNWFELVGRRIAEINFRVEEVFLNAYQINLTSSELEKLYGNRVRSRLREMFNLIGVCSR